MSTLYRDYRPQTFSEVIGQNHIKITLQNEILAGRPAGAYLFCGPRAVGKTTMARVLAKAINCSKRDNQSADPCNQCAICQSIQAGKNLDIVEIDAASNTGVDNVRDNIIAFSRLAPHMSQFKVFIIDEVHMLSLSAFNALLKIVEEPPAYVVFILCTTEIQKVPATIVSRCERFDFRRISVLDIIKKLRYIAQAEGISISDDILENIARRSDGHLRDAESLLGQILSLGDKEVSAEQAELIMPNYNSQETIDLLEHLYRKDAAKAVALINKLVDNGVNMKVFVAEMVVLLRKALLSKINPELENNLGLNWGEALEKKLSPLVSALSPERLIVLSKRFLNLDANYRGSTIAQLPLEIAVAELCLTPDNNIENDDSSFASSFSAPGSNRQQDKLDSIKPSASSSSPPSPSLSSAPYQSAAVKTDELAPSLNEEVSSSVVSALKSSPQSLSLTDLQSAWPELLLKIKKHNHSLSFVLQNCQARSMQNNRLLLAFKYKFHQDRLNDPNIKQIIDKVLVEVFGPGLMIESVLDENLVIKREANFESSNLSAGSDNNKSQESGKAAESSAGAGPNLMKDLLKTFGGEVLN